MKRKFSFLQKFHLSYLAYIGLFALFLYGVSSVGRTTVDKQEESLRTAMQRDITHCYAVEGFYPPSLEYIEEHYGLTYDKDRFFVDYQPIGSNIVPNVTIIRKE